MSYTNQNDKDSKDYLALGVFAAILGIFAISVFYLVGSSKQALLGQQGKTVLSWLADPGGL